MTRQNLDTLRSSVLVGFGRRAWHHDGSADSLANHYDGAIPVERVESLFDWSAMPAPVFATVNGRPVSIPDHVANVRSDTGAFLGLVSERYAVHQFTETLLDGTSAIVGQNGLGYASAGLLDDGAKAWVSVGLADVATTAAGVDFTSMLLASASHDGSLRCDWRVVTTLVVCDNTLGQAMAETGNARYGFRHTKSSKLDVWSAQNALGLLDANAESVAAMIDAECEVAITAADWAKIVDELCGPVPADAGRARTMAETRREQINGLYASDPRCAPWAGTAFGALQTFNTWSHHVQSVRGAHRDDRNMLATLAGDWDAHDANVRNAVRKVLTLRNA